jgi:hypothetical protein
MKQITMLLVLILGGCASTIELNNEFMAPNATEKGVVVISVTNTGLYGSALSGDLSFTCNSGASGKLENYHGLARYIDGERLSIPIPANFQLNSQRPMGRIHVIQLPSGNCAFNNFKASATGMTTRTSIKSNDSLKIVFDVKANTYQYIGNFDMKWAPGGGRASFNDFYERDLTVIGNQNPSLLGRNVEKSIGKVVSL